MITKCKKLSTTVGATLAIALTAVTLQPSAQAVSSRGSDMNSLNVSTGTAATALNDAQIQQAIRTLEALPVDLKNADPKTTPNYEDRLSNALSVGNGGNSPNATYVNWFSCGLALGGAVVQYGVPVGKVIAWLKDGYKIFGGIGGLLAAIRSGAAAAEIGEDAAKILGGLLGVNDVVQACS